MNKISTEINKILAQWNPLGVDEDIALDEYKDYISTILLSIQNRQELMKCLEKILVDDMGLDYNLDNKRHVEDLQKVCNNLIEVYEKQKETLT